MNTLIPTPSGWTKLSDLNRGDEVFDEAGYACRVTATFDGVPEVAYRLWFSDGTYLDACSEHQWVTWAHRDRKAYLRSLYEDHDRMPEDWPAWRARRICGGVQARPDAEPKVYADSAGPRIRVTQEIVDTLTYNRRGDTNHSIPLCGTLQLPEKQLLVHPYVLGVWLADGTGREGVITTADEEVLEHIMACGETISPVTMSGGRCPQYVISRQPRKRDPLTGQMMANGSLQSRLRELGVLNAKHVPAAYLRASAKQRLALLQGLMDGDGYASLRTGIEFCNTNKQLADAVMELARSLGQKPTMAEGRSKLNGHDHGPKWRVHLRATIPVFRLSRKLNEVSPVGSQAFRSLHRMIVKAERITPVAMRCISVDSPHNMYLAGEGMIPTHNTWTGSNWIVEQAISHPGSEWAVIAPTFRDVRKTCVEGTTGIIQALQPGELVAYRRNEMQLVLAGGSVIYGYSADQPERLRGANLHGAWCVARGEPVLTSAGPVPIENVRPGMRVWTRSGWRKVTAQRLMHRDAAVVRIATASTSVRVTPDHRIWTQRAGWVEARSLIPGDALSVWAPDGDSASPAADGSSTRVERVEPAGRADVYDLTVEDAHEFTAGGIVVHNCDEIGSWRYPAAWYEGLVPALRVGEFPRVVVTTTPRVMPLVRDLAARTDGSVHITRGSTWENSENLAAAALAELKRRYSGTRLGRQELEGELLEDIDGALWTRADIDDTRITLDALPQLTRIVVAVDPAVTSGEDADETGIVVAGEGPGGQGYVLADLSMRGTPDQCMRRAVKAYYAHEADCIVAETNNGGDFIKSLLRAVDPQVPYKQVRASRGKRTRAEPVSSLYEQHRIHHVGCFPALEDQMCLPAGELVETARGQVPVEQIRAGDLVMTSKGFAPVKWAGVSGVTRTLTSITHACGNVKLTACHPIYLPALREFVSAKNVVAGHYLSVSPNWESMAGLSRGMASGGIGWQVAITGRLGENCSTGPYGAPTGAPYHEVTSSITRITIPEITGLKTSDPSLPRSMQPNIRSGDISSSALLAAGRMLVRSGRPGRGVSTSAVNAEDPSIHAAYEPSAAPRASAVESVTTVSTANPTLVYNLQVANGHPPEFYANGVLVHNCTWIPDLPSGLDDRVDALVWAVTELRGISAGSWHEAYGVTLCADCGVPYLVAGRDRCPNCGAVPVGV